MGAKIGFECVAPQHRVGIAGATKPDKLTIVNGEWAYCATSSQADGHIWKTTGGEEYPALLRRVGHASGRVPTETRAS